MRKIIILILVMVCGKTFSQIDYSDTWEDFYSYSNIKDFYFDESTIYAVCDNAIFYYDEDTLEYTKLSSVHGLLGDTIASFYYDSSTNKLLIGYENGFMEIVNSDGSIRVFNDINRLNIPGSKRINHFKQFGNTIYISTDFSILEFDINKLNFGDTFYIGDQSSDVQINQTEIVDNIIYAATNNGIYSADVNNTNLIDFNNWDQPQGDFIGDFKTIRIFENKLFTSKNRTLYQINAGLLQEFKTYPTKVIAINNSYNYLSVSLTNKVYVYNNQLSLVNTTQADTTNSFRLHNSFAKDDTLFLATKKHGILKKGFSDTEYEEIHPEGPIRNNIFAIEVLNNNLWAVYGGQDFSTFNFERKAYGYSHYNGTNWINTVYNTSIGRDLLDITIDPHHENKVYISSYENGLLEVVDDVLITSYNHINSGLDETDFTWDDFTCTSSANFDSNGDLWVTNAYTENRLKKWDTVNSWKGYSFTEEITDNRRGLGDVIVDKNNNKWLEMRGNGVLVLDRSGTKKRALTTIAGKGNLPSNMVYSIAADKNNRIWIGTLEGLVRFDNVSNLFQSNIYNAKPIIIKLEGGTGDDQGQKLLGNQPVIAIAIDGADNKWFGTKFGGVLSTNPSGQKTLHVFNKSNSPLPSNSINQIKVDDSTGKVYFATSNGIVAFNNNVAPFGNTLGETYAYPNPSTKENEFITIDGRHGTHLPRGTNVKILDSAGYLVYETNVIEGIELKGGKAVWNKRNLANRKVASGIYIILLTLPDTSETSITKVAIIN